LRTHSFDPQNIMALSIAMFALAFLPESAALSFPSRHFTSTGTKADSIIHSCPFQTRTKLNIDRKSTPHTPEPHAYNFLSVTSSTSLYGNANNEHFLQSQEEPHTIEFNIPITEVDMRYNLHTPLTYNPKEEMYTNTPSTSKSKLSTYLSVSYLKHFFLPSSVTPSYYNYIRWRITQRYINAVVHVIGTQSLLMGLGLKSTKVGFASASVTWVCKDALGKIARMIWASKMGQQFDSDAKRWRFRSSLVFALGNFLEICALAFPKWFLAWATLSNAMKQMSMLTSSATRNALYNSFSIGGTGTSEARVVHNTTNSSVAIESISSSSKESSNERKIRGNNNIRDGGGANIGDITAKGEAQIAVVDLLGIASGIVLSKMIGVRVRNVLMTWFLLQICEIGCMYREIRSVVFRVLNFERLWSIVEKFVEMNLEEEETYMEWKNDTNSKTYTVNREHKQRNKVISFYSHDEKYKRELIPTPMQMSNQEKIFLPPEPLARRANCFGSFGRTMLNPTELQSLLEIFKGEKFLLIVGENTKKKKKNNLESREHCHVILHKDAANTDIVKSTLALGVLRESLSKYTESHARESDESAFLRTQDCLSIIEMAKDISDSWFPKFLKTLQSRGWATPARYMFGKVTMRADWPITTNTKIRKKGAVTKTAAIIENTNTTSSTDVEKNMVGI